MKAAVLGALVLALGLVGVPAQAESTYGSTAGIDGVLYDDCRSYPYRYSVAVPSEAGYRDLEVWLYGPDGRLSRSDHVSLANNVESGSSSFVLCPPTNGYGTYTIRARVDWGIDESTPTGSSVLDDSHFTMRKPRTRTSLTVSTRRPAYGQLVTYRIRVWDERPTGYDPTAFAWVHLENRVDGRWVRMKGTRTLTHSTGRVKLRLRYRQHHQRMRIRSVAETAPTFSRSVSPRVRLW